MKKVFVITAALIMLLPLVFAQVGNAGIYGTVTQPNSSAMPDVTVTLSGDFIGQKSIFTSAAGNFRFPGLPPGTYQLKFDKEGFKTVIYKEIRIYVEQNKSLHVEMETGPAAPPVIVTGESGAVDKRSPAKNVHITGEMLQSLPTARNPWTIINLVPGLFLDRQDVGGSESGQQSSFYGLGANWNDTTWLIDGVNITGPQAVGSAPTYLNTNTFEEIQVTLAANDITSYTGGTRLNFVTKRGGSRLSGNFHLYVSDEAWEMSQDLPDSITKEGWGSPGVFRLYQYGANLGGPIIRDKLWFFGSYAIQDIHARTIDQSEDSSWISGKYGKIDFQFGKTSGSLKFSQENMRKWDVYWLGASNQAPETARDQTFPFNIFQGSIQQEMGNLLLQAKCAVVHSRFTLNPNANQLNDNYIVNHQPGPDWYDYYTPSRWWTGSSDYYTTNTRSLNLSLDGHYFLEGVLGGDHEIRFGADYYAADTTSQDLYPNQRRLFIYDRNNPQDYKEIWWVQDYMYDVGFKRISLYLADTITFGRLTANIGLRWDKETGCFNEVTIPGLTFNGVPIFEEYLGELSLPARDIDAAFRVLSPRVSLTYDINGNGRNVVKASYARYGSHSGNGFADFLRPVRTGREIDVYWNDLDGDLEPDLGEWEEDSIHWLWWNLYIFDPNEDAVPNMFDPDYNSPILDEITLGFEKALGEDFVVALNALYKKESNLTWDRGMFTNSVGYPRIPESYNPGDLETAGNWHKLYDYVFSDGKTTKPVYGRYFTPLSLYRMNHGSGTYNIYKALQFVLSKKLSHGWMVDASFTLSDWKSHLDADEHFDKTNFDFFNGGTVAPLSGGSGLSQVYVNSRWQLKIAGLYQLPFGINLTGVFQAREGYIIAYFDCVDKRCKYKMYEPGKKFGDDRLPAFWMLDLGLEKTFRLSSTTSVTLLLNGYNITNNSTTLSVNPRLGDHKDEILRILNPGIFQFGVRVSF